MPELPEVETLRRELGRVLPKKKIVKAKVLWPKTVAPFSVADFSRLITGLEIEKVERQAKILIVNFRGPLALAFHLKMTGQLIYRPKSGKLITGGHPLPEKLSPENSSGAPEDELSLPNKHTRLILFFQDGSILYFNDLRKFGWARLVNDNELSTLTKHLGTEPLSKQFSDSYFASLFTRFPKRTVKQILMDQRLIAGVGNIYADESAFLAGILPTRKASLLSKKEIALLREKLIEVLKLSIKLKGTSSRNYRRSDGRRGGFVEKLFVYGRDGKPCKICGTPIKKIKHNGRGTHFCPQCQK